MPSYSAAIPHLPQPDQTTTESALLNRWNGQLYAVLGQAAGEGRWQLRLWWKPFVTLIWLGALLIALGGIVSAVGHVLRSRRQRHREEMATGESIA